MALLHEKFGSYILGLAKHASKTGEPIVRYMEYEFPNEGYENIKDQFMLGKKISRGACTDGSRRKNHNATPRKMEGRLGGGTRGPMRDERKNSAKQARMF